MHPSEVVATCVLSLGIASISSNVGAQTRWQVPGSVLPTSTTATRDPALVPDKAIPARPVRPARGPEIIYLNFEGGYESVSFRTLSAKNLRPEAVDTSAHGAYYGAGGGFRFGFLTLGGRVRTGRLDTWNLSTFDAELGARINLNRVEPYFTFAAGYAKLKGDGLADIRDLDIHGFNGRAGIGVDYYADKAFTLGVIFAGDVLAMSRPGIDLSTSPASQAADRAHSCDGVSDPTAKQQCLATVLHEAEGTTFGFAGTMSLVMGLHF
jgi:hypothetical protein